MADDAPVVRPIRSERSPSLGPLALIVAGEQDFKTLQRALALPDTHRLYLSRIYFNEEDPFGPTLAGPVMGAPYAAMLLEVLLAWGARKAIFFGWCGSIHAEVQSGDIVVPEGALIDEGTSAHYGHSGFGPVRADTDLRSELHKVLRDRKLSFHEGLVWTTDAIFRETPSKIETFKQRGAITVEMEFSALLSVSGHHSIPLAGLMTVSDELFTYQWRPGFRQNRFLKAREHVCQALTELVNKFES